MPSSTSEREDYYILAEIREAPREPSWGEVDTPPRSSHPRGKYPPLDELQRESALFQESLRLGRGPTPRYPQSELQRLATCLFPSPALKRYNEWLYTHFTLFNFFSWAGMEEGGSAFTVTHDSGADSSLVGKVLSDSWIWWQDITLQALSGTSAEVLSNWNIISGGQEGVDEMLWETRARLIYGLRTLGRYMQCRPHLELQILLHVKKLEARNSQHLGRPWQDNSALYLDYAHVRILTGLIDGKTQLLLQGLLTHERFLQPLLSSNPDGLVWDAIALHVHLLHVLTHLGNAPSERDEIAEDCVMLLSERRSLKPRLLRLLGSSPETHPVYQLLGSEWFEDTVTDREAKKAGMSCHLCRLYGALKSLSQCRGCRERFYCSKACQVQDWPSHREICRKLSSSREQVMQLRQDDPDEGFFIRQLQKWSINGASYANREALAMSLGLHRDLSRSRTHLIVRFADLDSTVRDARYRFRRRQAMGAEFEQSTDMSTAPMMLVTFGRNAGRGGMLGVFHCAFVSIHALYEMKYDRQWKKKVNAPGVAPPGYYVALPGPIPNEEFIFAS
ncbi:hypothetical protein EIP91_008700 [Steccherinum ochraceum]|uniref:MYND-type domain-containing protein n=1 Tax=Steccherinum ochraceum TaxID=92696 RepID=A0A4V2MV69_9APHY|nr:hypothetical protein EIP91_008700 [Steccherinum ochraceum]